MATVRATCPDCGDIKLTSSDVKVRVCVDDNAGSYAFRCPVCSKATAKPAESRVIQLLVGVGTPLTMWRRPAELSERHDGPIFTADELATFHQLLDTTDWFSRLSAGVRTK
ncbi:MAG TPA: hypothetical protein VGV93_13705 [Acidimicrobiales bacterium]|nr:hypothetical protein [Acidimicrobiales bacterium]